MEKRLQKQIIIAFIYFVLWFLFFTGIYLLFKGPAPTCFDGKQNQKETGIDCGGPCKPCIESLVKEINVINAGFIETIPGRADLYAYIENPNQNFGVATLEYTFEVYDFNENIIATKWGKTFILPQQKRYIIEQAVALKSSPNKVLLKIGDPQWTGLENYEAPNIAVKNKNYRSSLPDEHGFMTLEGLIVNRSNFDFAKVEVLGILKNSFGEIVGVGRSVHNTITANQERIFKIVWPNENPELKNASAEAYVLTNVFDNDNFLKAFGVKPRYEKR